LISGINELAVLFEALSLLLPPIGVNRLEHLSWKRAVYNGADFLKRRRFAGRQDLHRDVSQGRCLGWASEHSSSGGTRSELVK
jgi:hypothetical protein